MNDSPDTVVLLEKAVENLASAVSDHAAKRYNACANRAYYACFQAAIAALIRAGVTPGNRDGTWGHGYVQSRFAGELIGRRKLYPAVLRDTLARLEELRERADYHMIHVSEVQSARAVTRARTFVQAIRGSEAR